MTEKLKVLDLFSGLGGFSLGLERTGHFETVAFCDNDKFSKLILNKHWKGKKVYEDVREITKEKLIADGIELPDVVTGGFPCQPFSVAGKQKGTSDDRHLWPEMFRIIKALKPRIVVGENVRGIVNIQDGMVFETVCTNLEDEGYEVQAFNIPAAGVGAPHRRERIWFIAVREESVVNSDNIRFEQHSTTKEETSWRGTSATPQSTSNVGNTQHNGSPTSEIGRRNEEINGGTEKRQNSSFEFERTSGREDNENLSINVANTNDEGLRTRIGGSDDDHAKESRSRGTDGGRSTSDDERHNTTSTTNETMDVANAESFRSRETRYSDQEERSEGSRATQPNGSRGDVANTERQRLEGFSEQSTTIGGQNTRTQFGNESSRGSQSRDVANANSQRQQEQCRSKSVSKEGDELERSSGEERNGWWDFEPNVGRVAHGLPGRVHRLKGLGNSIVPQIVEEIGKALIKGMK